MWRLTKIQELGEAYHDVLDGLRRARASVHAAVLRHEDLAYALTNELSPEDMKPKGWMSLGDGYVEGVGPQLKSGRHVEACARQLRDAEAVEAVSRAGFLRDTAACCRTAMEKVHIPEPYQHDIGTWSESRWGYYADFAQAFRRELRGRVLEGLGCHQRGFH